MVSAGVAAHVHGGKIMTQALMGREEPPRPVRLEELD